MLLLAQTCSSVERQQAVGTNGRYAKQTVASDLPCLALPMAHSVAIENQFSLGRAYDVYFDETRDIRTGDKLTIGSDTYVVKLVQTYYLPNVSHLRAMCEQEVS